MATKAEIRSAILEIMTEDLLIDQSRDVTSLEYEVRRRLERRAGEEPSSTERRLDRPDRRRCREVIWEFISTGVLVPFGGRGGGEEWPWLSLTTEAEATADLSEPVPSDPDGFLQHVDNAFPGLPDTVSLYLREAVLAFNRRLYVAASVMLGVAAEGLLLELASAIRASHSDDTAGREWYSGKIEKQFALGQYRAIVEKLEPIESDLPRELRERFDSHFRSIRALIREQRNEDGHPTGNARGRDDLLPSLHLFAPYARLVAGLIAWLGDAPRF